MRCAPATISSMVGSKKIPMFRNSFLTTFTRCELHNFRDFLHGHGRRDMSILLHASCFGHVLQTRIAKPPRLPPRFGGTGTSTRGHSCGVNCTITRKSCVFTTRLWTSPQRQPLHSIRDVFLDWKHNFLPDRRHGAFLKALIQCELRHFRA